MNSSAGFQNVDPTKIFNPEEPLYCTSLILEKCLRINSCFDPSSRSSLQFLNDFDYIDNHNSSVIH